MASITEPEPWVIDPLSRRHDRKRFDCGEPALDDFIRQEARQQQDKHVGRTFVAVEPSEERVLGFYTLAAASIAFEHLPPDIRRRLPRYPVPAVRIGRLAVDSTMQGKGLGAALLRDALLRVVRVAEADLGIVGVIVDAKNEAAKRFYESCGFVALPNHPLATETSWHGNPPLMTSIFPRHGFPSNVRTSSQIGNLGRIPSACRCNKTLRG